MITNLWKMAGWSLSLLYSSTLLVVHQKTSCRKILKFNQLQK